MAFNPLIWKGFDLQDKAHEQLFMSQLADLLNALNSAKGLANLLNGQGTLGATALNHLSLSQTITANLTVNLANVTSATIDLVVSTVVSPTLILTNLAQGTELQIRFGNTSGSTVIFKINATDPSGSAYSVMAYSTALGSNMVSTGASVLTNTNWLFKGNTSGLFLEFLAVHT